MTNEKRRFFRITDSIGLSFRFASAQKPELKLSTEELAADAAIDSLNAELNALVNAIWSTDPKIAKALGLLNRKIELLYKDEQGGETPVNEQYDYNYEHICVNMSASGIAFDCGSKLNPGQRLEMLLLLKPANTPLAIKGSVVSVNEHAMPNSNEPLYHTGIDFDLSKQEEERLIQHIVQRQVQLLARQHNS